MFSILRPTLAALTLCVLPAAEPPATAATSYHAGETADQRAQRLAWFREARFGMFIHWGVYSVPAGQYRGHDVPGFSEWMMNRAGIPVAEYRDYATRFTAAKYDPEAWAALARRAGMRYVVLTAKHHDGCALFESAVSDWSIPKASAAKRDVIAPLEKAVRAQGLHFGLYFSHAQDWVNPGGAVKYRKAWTDGPFAAREAAIPADLRAMDRWDPAQAGDFDQFLKGIAVPQFAELMSRYHPDLLWWDTPTKYMTPERAALFLPTLAQYPGLVMNNRLGGGIKGDLETPEQHIPPNGYADRDFEVCMTINNSWGFKAKDEGWKPVRKLLQNLSDIASKGGNFLLNVGPDAEGVIPAGTVDRLEAIGRWMAVNGEAIHGTRASPFATQLPWGRVTRKADASGAGETLYLQVWNWPADGKLTVPTAPQAQATATLLATRTALTVADGGSELAITLPATAPDADISVIALHLPTAVQPTNSAP